MNNESTAGLDRAELIEWAKHQVEMEKERLRGATSELIEYIHQGRLEAFYKLLRYIQAN